MKKIITLLILISMSLFTMAQVEPTKIPDNRFGEGGYRTESTTTNVKGETEYHREYYDKAGNKQARETTVTPESGSKVITTILFDCKGGERGRRVEKKDQNGKTIEDISESYDEKTKEVIRGYRYIWEEGGMKLYIFDDETGTYEPARIKDKYIDMEYKFSKIRPGCCNPVHDVFLGYSFLSPTGDDAESIPIGAHLAYAYLLTQTIGLVGDMSIHTKKDQDLRITRAFLMGGLQYQLIKQREKNFLACIRLLFGLATDRQKYEFGESSNTSKANAFAIAAGFGLGYPLNRKLAIAMLADYIHTRFGDDGQGNIRVSAGLRINLGCK